MWYNSRTMKKERETIMASKKTSFRMDEDSIIYLKILAKHYGISEAGVIRQLLRLKMREEGLGTKEISIEKK